MSIYDDGELVARCPFCLAHLSEKAVRQRAPNLLTCSVCEACMLVTQDDLERFDIAAAALDELGEVIARFGKG